MYDHMFIVVYKLFCMCVSKVSNTPKTPRVTQKVGRFTQVPQNLLNSASGGEEDSWKCVTRFICNISGCNASFNHKRTLVCHQKTKHGAGNAPKRSSYAPMPDLDQGDTFG